MPNFTIPIGGIIKCVTYCRIPGQVSTNSHKWQLTSLSSGSLFNSTPVVLQYDATMQGLYSTLLSSNAEYYGTQMYLLNPLGLPPRPDSVNGNQAAGDGGAGLLPSQTSGLIKLVTATLGKIGQGRTYIPFPAPVKNEANGSPTTVYVDDLVNLKNSLTAPFNVIDGGITATFRPCLYRGGTDTPRFIDSGTAHDAWATQRRRGAFGRLNATPF